MDRPEGAPAPWWHIVLWWSASVVAALLHNGLWSTPNLAFISLIARRPGENPFRGALSGDYLLTDVSLTTLARVLGQSDPHELARLHLVVLLVGWATVTWLAYRRFGHAAARALTVVIAASPLVTVSMQWLGQPDPLTGMCGIAMVLVRRRWTVLALGVLAGLTHPEQAVFMAAVAGAVRCVMPEDPPSGDTQAAEQATGRGLAELIREMATQVATSVGGVVIGWALTHAWFRLNDIVIRTPRTKYLDYGLDAFVDHHTRQPLGLLWTFWGPLWFVIGAVVVAAWWRRSSATEQGSAGSRESPVGAGRAWTVMALAAGLSLAPVAITLDETRVYSVITAPLLAGAAAWIAAQFTGRAAARAAAALLLATALLPGGFATGTTSWRSQLDTADMVSFLLDGDVPDGAELTPWLLSPFDFVIPELPT